MNKDEMKMIEEMLAIIQQEHSDCMSNLCENCEYYAMKYCGSVKKANALYNAGCRIVGEDEVVLTKGAYESISNKAKANVVKALEIKQETARAILKELNDEGYKIYKQQGNTFDAGNFNWLIAYTMRKYGIELE